mgnify:CR=1 FL=1
MNPQSLPFVISALCGIVAWGAVAWKYIWPLLKNKNLRNAVEPILYLHAFRFIGLAFIAQGAIGPDMPMAWAIPAAYGDVIAALLAVVTLLFANTKLLKPFLWIFSIWGLFDLIRAAATGPIYDVPTHLHGTYFIPVLGVPLLIWTHVVLIRLLLRK